MEWLTPEQRRKCIERWRRERFLVGAQWQLAWRSVARRHKRSADLLYVTALSAFERSLARNFEELKDLRNRPAGEAQCASRPLVGDELIEHLDMELIEEYFLLIGYALENLFKGYLLMILPELVQNEARLDKLVTTHDLCELSRDCGFDISPEETEFLQHLSMCVVWKSKYPVPLKRSDYLVDEEMGKRLVSLNPANWETVKSLADDLYSRLCVLLECGRR